MSNDLLKAAQTLSVTFFFGQLKYRCYLRELVVNVVAKAGGIHYGQGNADTILFKFYSEVGNEDSVVLEFYSKLGLPTFTGLILIPSSTCAVPGLSEILWARTSDSHSVLTKVVRPVPEAPVEMYNKNRKPRGKSGSMVNNISQMEQTKAYQQP